MTTHVYIEPAFEQRQAFARWCIEQTPRIETASATGSNVPVELYPEVPVELLEGAYVDGYLYRSVDPVPAVRPDGSQPPAQRRARKPSARRGGKGARGVQTAAQDSRRDESAETIAVATAAEGGSEQ